MTDAAAVRARPPSPRRGVARLALALLVLGPLILGLLALDTAPGVADRGPPDAAAAARALTVAESLRTLVETEGASGSWSIGEDELNAVLAAGQRIAPGVFGRARVGDDALGIGISAGAPLMPGGLWANLDLTLAPSESGLSIASARLGRLPLPPALARLGLRLALDRVLGDGMGAAALDGVAGLRLAPPRATVLLQFDEEGRATFFERLRARAFEGAGSIARKQVYVQLWHLDKAVKRDELPRRGSMLPYLRQVVETAGRSDEPDREAMRGALYALALYCGDPAFGDVVGVGLESRLQGDGNGCEGTTLAGRDDLKRHFAISAGLYAATTSGTAAFGVGELKELLDSNADGGGFSFDDIAADAAGVRLAAAFLGAPRSAWGGLLARIDAEADMVPALDDLPNGLGEVEFRARYGDVDSPAYAATVAEIERRIDGLGLYAAPAGG